MHARLLKAIVSLVLTSALLVALGVAFRRDRVIGALIDLGGAACLLIVALTHLFEALKLFPSMRWGQPNSPGHYVDLLSAVLGVSLVLIGYLFRLLRPRRQTRA